MLLGENLFLISDSMARTKMVTAFFKHKILYFFSPQEHVPADFKHAMEPTL